MRAKSVALLALALVCGMIAALGITQVMAKRNADPGSPIETKTIFVAAKEIPAGTIVTPAMIQPEEWGKVPSGCVLVKEDIEGRRTRAKLFAGEPILEQKLWGKGAAEQGADALIPKGYRVVPVRVDPVTINGGLVLPGSRVDLQVFFGHNDGLGVKETSARTVLQNVKVFAVNDIVSGDSGNETKSIAGRTVSLLVTPAQAEIVTLASEMGSIRLIMRSPEDDVIAKTHGALPRDVLNNNDPASVDAGKGLADYLSSIQAKLSAGQAAPPAEPVQPVPQAKPAKPPEPRFTMRLLKGTDVNDVEMQGDALAATWKVNGLTSGSSARVPGVDLPGMLGGAAQGKDDQKPGKALPPTGRDAKPEPIPGKST